MMDQYELAMNALMPFVYVGWIKANPEELELMVHAVLDRMSPDDVEAMVVDHIRQHRAMIEAMGRTRLDK